MLHKPKTASAPASMTPRQITLGFYAAAAVNVVGVLGVSQLYSNTLLNAGYPAVFSNFGLVCIQLWGLAYFSVAKSYAAVPGLIGVFAVEKLAYVISWALWMSGHASELPAMAAASPQTAAFYAGYGLIDLAFGVFFAAVAFSAGKPRPS